MNERKGETAVGRQMPPVTVVVPGRTTKTMTVVGYTRQSAEEKRLGKCSIEEQAARIRAFADARKWQVMAIYKDAGEGGENLDRPGLLDLLANPDFQVIVVDTADRLSTKKKELDFLMALLDRLGITCVAATWSWDYLAQYMRHCYRQAGNPVYAKLDKEP